MMYYPSIYEMNCLAVAPIIVNVGAAILPAIVAALAGLAVALMKKPHVLLLVAVLCAGLWFGGKRIFGSDNAGRRRSGAPPAAAPLAIDWEQVARDRLRAGKQGIATAPTTGISAIERTAPTVYRMNMARSGHDGGPAPRNLRLQWTYNEELTMFLSSPSVVRDRVYGASCYQDATDFYGSLFCIDAESGRLIWRLEDSGDEDLKGFFSSPAVSADGRYLVIGQGLHPDANCDLLCINALTGALHWKYRVELHIESSPVIVGDMVIGGAGAIEHPTTHKVMSHPGFVFAVRISDGTELWRHPVADPESSPAVGDGVVYIGSGFNGRAVVALNIAPDLPPEKRLLWKTPTPYPATGAVTLTDDLVIVGTGNGDFVFRAPDPKGIVMALDRDDGQIRWTKELDGSVLGAVAAGDGILICPVGNGEVVALDQGNGNVLWRRQLSEHARVLAAPAFTGSLVYAVTMDGYLTVLDAKDGKLLERHYVNDKGRPGNQGLSISSPTVAAGRVFLGSETGGLRCYVGSAFQ